jgi:high-affinity nickel-transport protein
MRKMATDGDRRRLIVLFAGIVLANAAAWAWAWSEFSTSPALIGSSVLAYVLGLRHAIDPDHIAAIDNVTRKLLDGGKRPISVGLWFALGHSSLIIVACSIVAFTTANLAGPQFESWRFLGGVMSSGVSIGFLVLIAATNLVVLAKIWRTYRLGPGGAASRNDPLAGGVLSRIMAPVTRVVSSSWHMFPVGLLFALGFDTATEISIFGLSASEAAQGTSPWVVMIFPALFTAGMTLADASDGVLMLKAYEWAYVQPDRKLLYNLAMVLISVLVAAFVAAVEALGLIANRMDLSEGLWAKVAYLNDHSIWLSVFCIGLFGLVWLSTCAFSWLTRDRSPTEPALS